MSTLDMSKFNFTAAKRDELAGLARNAEAAERYEDMCAFMNALVKDSKNQDLSVDERNLLSVAYKNSIGARRSSWRVLSSEEYKDDAQAASYRVAIEKELETLCQEVLDLLENFLVPQAKDAAGESSVFYLKMTGDYYRYLAEILTTKDYASKAKSNYQAASDVADSKLAPTHPIRLGLALNYSVCMYEILKDQKAACDLAKKAFDDAISKLDQLDEASYKDSTLIMQLLRDNLTLWTSGDEEEA